MNCEALISPRPFAIYEVLNIILGWFLVDADLARVVYDNVSKMVDVDLAKVVVHDLAKVVVHDLAKVVVHGWG